MAVKRWKELEAMAEKANLSCYHTGHVVLIDRRTGDKGTLVYLKVSHTLLDEDRDNVMRAAAEAALRGLT